MIHTIATIIGEILVITGALTPTLFKIRKLSEGMKCQLRSEMLRIYYRNREAQEIRQYEYENFSYLYDAYKSLKGNSFIEKIHDEIKSWKVIS